MPLSLRGDFARKEISPSESPSARAGHARGTRAACARREPAARNHGDSKHQFYHRDSFFQEITRDTKLPEVNRKSDWNVVLKDREARQSLIEFLCESIQDGFTDMLGEGQEVIISGAIRDGLAKWVSRRSSGRSKSTRSCTPNSGYLGASSPRAYRVASLGGPPPLRGPVPIA